MKTTYKIVLVLFMGVLSLNCNNKKASNQQEKGNIEVISPEAFKEKSANQFIVDVRTPEEFAEGHIENSVNINFNDENFLKNITELERDKTKPIFLYCRSGRRSGLAAEQISEMGFKTVFDLEGGIVNWEKNNQPVIK